MEKKNTIKLLIVSPWESFWSLGNGAGVAEESEMVKGFERSGFEIHYLLPGTPDPQEEISYPNVYFYRIRNVFKYNFPVHNFIKALFYYLAFNLLSFAKASSVCRKVRPDIIYGLSVYATPVTFLVAKLFGVKCIVKLFGIMDFNQSKSKGIVHLLKHYPTIITFRLPVDMLLIKDDGTQGAEAARRYGLRKERIRIVTHAIDNEWAARVFSSDGIRESYGISPDAKVIVSLSRLVPSKGVRHLIEAMPMIMADIDSDAVLLVIGDGEERDSLADLASKLGVRENVVFAGAVRHDLVPRYLKAGDLLVSLNKFSNMARPTIEAMLCGLPVVALDAADTGTVVKDGVTGFLVRPREREAELPTKVVELLKDDEGRIEMGRRAQEYARTNFIIWDEKINSEIEMLGELVHRKV